MYTASGKACKSEAVGTVVGKVKRGGKEIDMVLNNVLYVPTFERNLFSSRVETDRLDASGANYGADFRIWKNDLNNPIVTGHRVGNLYVLDFKAKLNKQSLSKLPVSSTASNGGDN